MMSMIVVRYHKPWLLLISLAIYYISASDARPQDLLDGEHNHKNKSFNDN